MPSWWSHIFHVLKQQVSYCAITLQSNLCRCVCLIWQLRWIDIRTVVDLIDTWISLYSKFLCMLHIHIVNKISPAIWNNVIPAHVFSCTYTMSYTFHGTYLKANLTSCISPSPFICDDIANHNILALGIGELCPMNAVSSSLARHQLRIDTAIYIYFACQTTYTSNHYLQSFHMW